MKSAVMILIACLFDTGFAAPPKASNPKKPELRTELLRHKSVRRVWRGLRINWTKKNAPRGLAKTPAPKKAEYRKLAAAVGKIDADNTKWLKEVVKTHGWPGKSLVGKDGARSAWLLVQHADADRKFQRQCLDLITRLPKGEVAPQHLALLTDRVLLAEGKKQIYGTQFTIQDGKLVPRPLKAPAGVDRRRKAVGLPPLAEYVKLLRKTYLGTKRK